MTTPLAIDSFRVIGIYGRGTPNLERIVLVADEAINLANYALVVGMITEAGGLLPFRDRFFWFGDLMVDKSTWVYVYTGPGQFRYTSVSGTTTPAIVYHWGSRQTLLHQPGSTMALVSFGEVAIINPPRDPRSLPKTQGDT